MEAVVETNNSESLSKVQLMFYSAVSFPGAVVLLPLVVLIPPLYGELGLNLAAMGIILMVARFSDVITDPIIGLLSDRTRTRFGRRKPWLMAGAPMMVIATYFLLVPPDEPSLLYFLGCIVAIYLAFTIIDLPHIAWGAEISGNYNERSKITAFREQFMFAGMLVAVSLPIVLTYFGHGGIRTVAAVEALIVCATLPVFVAGAIYFVPESNLSKLREQALTGRQYIQSLRLVVRNGPFVRILIGYTGSVVGSSMDAAVSFFFVKHVLLAEPYYFVALLVHLVASLLFIPVWRRISTRVGKHRTLVWAIIWYAGWAFCMPLLYFIPEYAVFFYIILQALKGISLGAFTFLTTSMAADVVDIDTIRSGEERTGLYFAAWGIVKKSAAALALFMALTGVAVLGFDATADPTLGGTPEGNSFAALMSLAFFYSVIPSCFKLCALPFLWNYPLTEERQKRIRGRLERKAARIEQQRTAEAEQKLASGITGSTQALT